jgi:CrcB protein
MSGALGGISDLHLLAVAVGAGLGAMCRAAVDRGMVARWGVLRLPYATLAVNVAGSFLLGVVLAWAAGPPAGVEPGMVDTVRLAVGTGFCGGLTTFSTFSFESFLLLREQRHRAALAYAALTMVLAMAGVVVGEALGSALA